MPTRLFCCALNAGGEAVNTPRRAPFFGLHAARCGAKENPMSHPMHKLALLAGLGLALAGISHAPPAAARGQVSIGIDIGVPPPPPRYERMPPRRVGYVWAPGYWRWSAPAHRHVWVSGYWVPMRHGYRYRPARWERHGHHWRFRDGRWHR